MSTTKAFFVFVGFAMVVFSLSAASVSANNHRYVYVDSNNYYTYDSTGRSYYSQPVTPSYSYQRHRDGIIIHSESNYGSTYINIPTRNNPWVCVGTGCSKTPYLNYRTVHLNNIHYISYGDNHYGASRFGGNPAVVVPWY